MENTNDATATTTETAQATTTVKALNIELVPAEIREAVKGAISEKNVIAEMSEVVITAKSSPTGKEGRRDYVKLTAVNARGMAALCGGKLDAATDKPTEGDDTRTDAQKAPGAADYFNYGFDLDVRATVRAKLSAELEGPEKSIKKAVDNLVANAGMSEADARTFVIAQRTKAGLAV